MNQNKGIGAYQNRPGYFMGGMIGGAILGALVNKIQGKDWKRGALFGGIGGGLGSVLSGSKFMPAAGAKGNWLQNILFKQGGPGNQLWSPRFPAISMLGQKVSPIGLAGGAAAAYMMGDPEGDRRKQEEFIAAQNEKDKEKKLAFYSKWFTNPWTGESMFNEGGIVNARPGYYNGGSATLDYTDPDLYTPTGEGSGPSSNPIQQIPLEPEPSFTDEFDELELAGLSDSERAELQSLMSLRLITPKDDPKYPQIEIRIQELMGRMGQETAMSEPHPMEGWYDMYTDQINSGEFTGTFDEFMEMIRDSDFTPDVARGGLMRLHAKDGLWANIHAKRKRIEGGSGETMRSPGSKGAPTDKALRESQATGGYMERPGYANAGPVDEKELDREKIYRALLDYSHGEISADEFQSMTGFQVPNYGADRATEYMPFDEMLPKLMQELTERGYKGKGGTSLINEYLEKAQGGIMGYYGGGMSDMDLTRGGASFGPGTGTSDDIPAMLSDGEFVVTANAVKNLGGGNRMLGAKRMYQMMNTLDPNSQTPAEMDTTGIA